MENKTRSIRLRPETYRLIWGSAIQARRTFTEQIAVIVDEWEALQTERHPSAEGPSSLSPTPASEGVQK